MCLAAAFVHPSIMSTIHLDGVPPLEKLFGTESVAQLLLLQISLYKAPHYKADSDIRLGMEWLPVVAC
jgi:hypothetical protein